MLLPKPKKDVLHHNSLSLSQLQCLPQLIAFDSEFSNKWQSGTSLAYAQTVLADKAAINYVDTTFSSFSLTLTSLCTHKPHIASTLITLLLVLSKYRVL